MSDSPEPDLDDFIVAMLRDVDETPASVRSRQIAVAVEQVGSGSSAPARTRWLGVAATIVVVVCGVVVFAASRGEHDSAETSSVASRPDGSAKADAAGMTETDATDDGLARPSADRSADAPVTTTAPGSAAQYSPEAAVNIADLGAFPDPEAARRAAADLYSLTMDSAMAVTDSALPPAGLLPCPLPPELGPPLWWATATIAGLPHLVVVTQQPPSANRAMVTPIGACAWS